MTVDWRPAHTLDAARQRAALLRRARDWFDVRDVLEVQTPMLDTAAVSDPNIESIAATLAVKATPHYLHTSPEHAMKRLLAAGFPDIYQVCTVFRDGEIGRRHQPEFTMIEWYRHGMMLDGIVADTVALVRWLLNGTAGEPAPGVQHYFYDDLLLQASGVTSDSATAVLRRAAGDHFPESLAGRRDALLDYLFAEQAAATFTAGELTVVTHFPASQAALSRIDPDSGRALRFELFHGTMELANGFVELTDADEQRRRFEDDQRRRRLDGRMERPLDERLLAALASGLPDCAGVALGFDRVAMLAIGSDTIDDVLSFPHR